MSIKAEDFEKVQYLIAGLYKFDEEQPFAQAVLGLTDDELLIYNDHCPDRIEGDAKIYQVRRRIPLESIDVAVDEKIVKRPELAGLNRLTFVFMSEEPDAHFFYYLENDRAVKDFLKALRRSKVSVVDNKLKLNEM